MSTNNPEQDSEQNSEQDVEQREGSVNLSVNETCVQAGFRVLTAELLAGGPIELEFFVENQVTVPLQLAISGDRMRQRPGQFNFSADFAGAPVADPMAGMPDMGGPATVVLVAIDRPWQQPLVLNQFLCLEQTRDRLTSGAIGRLDLTCQRTIALAATETAALLNQGAQEATVHLTFNLRRDDAALAALIARCFDQVIQGPPSLREHPLSLLLSLRSGARPQIEALTRHPDAAVVARARQVLALL